MAEKSNLPESCSPCAPASPSPSASRRSPKLPQSCLPSGPGSRAWVQFRPMLAELDCHWANVGPNRPRSDQRRRASRGWQPFLSSFGSLHYLCHHLPIQGRRHHETGQTSAQCWGWTTKRRTPWPSDPRVQWQQTSSRAPNPFSTPMLRWHGRAKCSCGRPSCFALSQACHLSVSACRPGARASVRNASVVARNMLRRVAPFSHICAGGGPTWAEEAMSADESYTSLGNLAPFLYNKGSRSRVWGLAFGCWGGFKR